MNNDKLIPVDKYPDLEDLFHTIAMITKLLTTWHFVSDDKLTDVKLLLMHESLENCKKKLEALLPEENKDENTQP